MNTNTIDELLDRYESNIDKSGELSFIKKCK